MEKNQENSQLFLILKTICICLFGGRWKLSQSFVLFIIELSILSSTSPGRLPRPASWLCMHIRKQHFLVFWQLCTLGWILVVSCWKLKHGRKWNIYVTEMEEHLQA